MKILYIITKSTEGGAQTHVSQLSKRLKEEGNETAVMSYPGGWLEGVCKKEGIGFYPNQYLSNSFNPFKGLKAIKEINKAVKNFKPNLISLHSSSAGLWGRLAIRNRVKTIFTAHGWAFTEGVSSLRKIMAIFVEKLVSRFCERIICVSDFDKNLALLYKVSPKEKLLTIHNGVEIGTRKVKNYSYPLRIVFVGRLSKPKKQMMLLEAFNEFPEEIKDKAEIVLIGGGEEKEKIEEYVLKNNLQEKIKILGSIPREAVFEELDNSHIFVLLSDWEGFPRSILEAMSCGLSIITTDVGGVKESVNQDCGFIIERNDREKLKEILIKLLSDVELIKRLGNNSRKRVEENFSLEKMIKKTKEVYGMCHSGSLE